MVATEEDALGVRHFLEMDVLTVLLLEYFSFFLKFCVNYLFTLSV